MDEKDKDKDFFESYCPKCEGNTTHRWVEDDEMFEFAAECMNCNMVWEMEKGKDNG